MPVRVSSMLIQPERSKPVRKTGPRLDVPWQRRRGRISESLRALLAGGAPRKFVGGSHFRDCWVNPRMPRGWMAASAFWHIGILVLLVQFGTFLWSHPRGLDMPNVELTWSGPIEDLPLISPGATHKTPSPFGDPAKPLPQRGADAFHPRQTLISAPKHPNHPRQTLIRPDAPPVPPKFLPALPNIVQLSDGPVRPQAKIAADRVIAKRPMQAQRTQTSVIPDLPNQEKNLTDLNFAPAAAPAKPAMTISTGAATVAAPKQRIAATSQNDAPPDIGGGNNPQTVIALSATPGPIAPPVPVPVGNLLANVSISPDGARRGTPGGTGNGGAENGGAGGGSASAGGTGGGNGNGVATVVPGLSVTGGNPSGKKGISGLGGGSGLGLNPRANGTTPASADSARVSGKPSDIPLADRIRPGATPEHIFGTRSFYSLNVSMPNISSVSGSWILKFAELDDPGDPAVAKERAKTLAAPIPLRKVDPRYPQDQVRSHVQGEVVLYALIREDGSVDSIQVLRSLEPALDKCAMEALAEWKFTPASRNGTPVPLEAVVHIPFRYVRKDY